MNSGLIDINYIKKIKDICKKISYEKIFDFYFFLFIFTTINREFSFFGIDLRYVLVILSLGLIAKKLFKKKFCITNFKKNNTYEGLLILFYLLLFCSNIMLVFNNEELIFNEFISLMILHTNNFLALITFILNKKMITMEKTIDYLKVSIIILTISFIFILFNIPIPSFLTNDARMISVGADHVNLFGNHFRIAGFAEDANYAFLFFYTVFLIFFNREKSFEKFLILVFCFLGMGFSFSKTQVLMIIPSLFVYLFVFKYKIKYIERKYILFVFLFGIFLSPILLLKINFLGSLNTLSTRYNLWQNALDMFYRNCFLPSGVGGFRFYNYHNYFNWMVQTHSTYLQVLTELGIIPFFLLLNIVYKAANKYRGTSFLILLNYLCFSITSETLYLQYFIFVIYILYVINTKYFVGGEYRQ